MTVDPARRARLRRTLKNRVFYALCLGATVISCLFLVVLAISIVRQGAPRLAGFDAQKRAELREPREPDEIGDLDRVDWPALAAELGVPALAALADADFAAVGREQGLEWADELDAIDWTRVPGLAAPEALAAIDWEPVVEAMRMPGAGAIRSWLLATGVGDFVTAPPSRKPEQAGIGPALAGTIWICAVCGLVALPLGVGTAIFLEEYRPKRRVLRRIHDVIQLNIANLAGVPSIVYGIVGLTAFVGMFGLFGNALDPAVEIGDPSTVFYFRLPFGRGVVAGGLTLMLVILPIVIISSQEALRAVPDSLRQGALALGSTRWQMIRRMTLPAAIPGIMTGSILAMSRAIGEAAPVLVICGIVFVRFLPKNLADEFTALPLQIYNWAGRPQDDFHAVAAAGIMVLLVALLAFNALAILIRQKFQRPLQ